MQRGLLIDALRALGPSSHPSPAFLNHWRTRLDGQAAIYEALWEKDKITIQAFKNRLGAIFGVDPDSIDHSVNQVVFAVRDSAVVTFSRTGTDHIRVVFFGYAGDDDWPNWDESGDEARAYLNLYQEEWDEVL